MASLQVDPWEDVITETEATSKEPQTPPPPPPAAAAENANTVDEEDLEDLTAPPYDEKVGINSDDEDADAEYSSFIESEEAAAPPSGHGGAPATFDDLNEDDEDDVV